MTGFAPGLKVCGITRRADAQAAAAAGASFLGVVLAPGGPRTVAPEAARDLLAGLPARRVGVFVDASADALRGAGEAAALDILQLHGDESPELVRALREEGRWEVWKAIRPRDADEFRAGVDRYAGTVDALLLDGFSTRAHGGTGTRFPWEEVAPLRDEVPSGTLLVVAGGMRAADVDRAVALLRPDVVDVSSGVETSPGVKDGAEIEHFAAALRGSLQARQG